MNILTYINIYFYFWFEPTHIQPNIFKELIELFYLAPMNIGFDAKRIFYNQTGLGNYSRSVLQGLVRHFPQHEYHLYTPGTGKFQNFMQENPMVHRHFPETFFTKKFPSIWRSRLLKNDLKQDKIQIFHGLSNELPAGILSSRIKSLVTIHDLIFLHYPKQYPFIDRKIYQNKFASAIHQADIVIATSENTRNDILKFYDCNPEKVKVVYQNCDPIFSKKVGSDQIEKVRKKYGLNRNYVLSVGTLEQRKNHLNLAKAFVQANVQDTDLLLIGKKADAFPLLEKFVVEHKMEMRIKFIHQLDFVDLPAIYQAAMGLAYVSIYEGFGIPVLEAMRSGIPVLCSASSSLAEVGGKASILVDPNNVDEISNGLNQLTINHKLRESLLSLTPAHLEKFDEYILSRQLMQLYEGLLK